VVRLIAPCSSHAAESPIATMNMMGEFRHCLDNVLKSGVSLTAIRAWFLMPTVSQPCVKGNFLMWSDVRLHT